MKSPLSGINVIELGQFIAAPYCAQLLGDAGADVLKIEPLNGDESRRGGVRLSSTEATQFLNKNRNKRSMACDLRNPDVRQIVADLLARADVVITNLRPGKAKELGIDFESVTKVNPRIIYAENTGFGPQGPLAGLPGMDVALQGYTGLAQFSDDGIAPIREPVVDYTAAMLMAWGVSTALYSREKTGQGQRLEVSLLQAALVLQNNEIHHVDEVDEWRDDYVAFLKESFSNGASWQDVLAYRDSLVPKPLTGAYYGFFEGSDGVLCLAGGGSAIQKKIAKFLGVSDPLLETGTLPTEDRTGYVAQQRQLVASRLKEDTVASWIERFKAVGIPVSRVQLKDELLNDEQVWANDYLTRIDHPEHGKLSVVSPPVKFSGTPLTVRRPPPGLSEGAEELLAELGISDEKVQELLASGVVRSG